MCTCVVQRVDVLVVRGNLCCDVLTPLFVGEVAAGVTVVVTSSVVVDFTVGVGINDTKTVAVGEMVDVDDADRKAVVEGDDAAITRREMTVITRKVSAFVADLAHEVLARGLRGNTPCELVGQ